jgi:acyl carrier protein
MDVRAGVRLRVSAGPGGGGLAVEQGREVTYPREAVRAQRKEWKRYEAGHRARMQAEKLVGRAEAEPGAAPGPSPKAQPELIEQVRQKVAKTLKKGMAQIDVRKPLGAQRADELDIVEILMTIEEAFNVEIADDAAGVKPDEIATLTVQKLADIIAGLMERQKR